MINDVVIQIGAHIGDTKNDSIFRNISLSTQLICFEPVPYLFDQLQENYDKAYPGNDFIFVNKAVSNRKGSREMTVVSQSNNLDSLPGWVSQLSSFTENHVSQHAPNIKTEVIQVETTTLNDIVTDYGVTSIDLLQIDTEGHDFEILMAYDFSVRPKQIIFEHRHMDGPGKVGKRYQQLVTHLTKLGFTLRKKRYDTICTFPLVTHILQHKRSLLSRARLKHVADLVIKYRGSGACFVECGVGKGGCLATMKYFARQEDRVFGFDSFEGMPSLSEKDENDSFAQKWVGRNISDGIESVYNTFHELGVSLYNVNIVKGFFEETLPDYLDEIDQIAILRLDSDWYESTAYCLEMLYPKVMQGGVVLIDDYGTFPGCRNAVDEYREKHAIAQPLLEFERGTEWYWVR